MSDIVAVKVAASTTFKENLGDSQIKSAVSIPPPEAKPSERENLEKTEVVSPLINNNNKENIMAEVDTTQLSQEHGAIRHDLAVESARLSAQIGAEFCGTNKHIGDMRQEDAENFGHTRRDIQGVGAELSRALGEGFCDTSKSILQTGSDIRQEAANHKADVRESVLQTGSDIRLEAANHKADVRESVLQTGSNIRLEAANHKADVREAVFTEGRQNFGAIKDSRHDVITATENQTDRVVDRVIESARDVSERFYGVGRDLAELRQGQATIAKDIELNALKTQIEGQKNTQYLSDKISVDGEKTRTLINDLKYHDLSRDLVERNTALVNCEQDRRCYRDKYHDSRFDSIQNQYAGQWAQLQNQVQAFQSQLQETRQGMVNFGNMAGVGQTSTSNNVR